MAKENSQDLVDGQGHRTLDRLQDKEGRAEHDPPQNPTIEDLERELFGATLDDISNVSEFAPLDEIQTQPVPSGRAHAAIEPPEKKANQQTNR